MRRLVTSLTATLLAGAAWVGPATTRLGAQAPAGPTQLQRPTADGRVFWGSLGMSVGRAALTCRFCTEEARSSYAGALAFGMRVRGRTRVGLELQGWRYANTQATRRVYAAAPVVQVYPWRQQPVFIKVGFGAASFSSSDGEDRLSNTSFAAIVGGGVEIPVTPNYVLTPYITFLTGAGGSLRLNDDLVTHASGVTLLQYGLAIALR